MKMLQQWLAIAFFGLLAMPVKAFESAEIGLHAWSHHTNPEGCFEQVPGLDRCQDFTPGLYVRGVRDEFDPIVGYYRNSVGRPTFYAGGVFTPWQKDRFALEIAVAAASGYPQNDVVPLVLTAIRFDLKDDWSTSVGVIPRIGDANPTWVIHFTLSKRFAIAQ